MANTHSIDLEASSTQYLSHTDNASLSPTGGHTIEMWVKLESLPSSGSTMFIASKYGSSGNRSWIAGIWNDSGTYKIGMNVSQNGTNTIGESAYQTWAGAETGVWHHIAVVYEASTRIETYLDGSSLGSYTSSVYSSLYDSTDIFAIGSSQAGTGNLDGLIDDVRYWGDARTTSEISSNYNTELNGDEAGLISYWKLNNSLVDENANGNDLTNNNSATFSTDVPFGGASTFVPKIMIF